MKIINKKSNNYRLVKDDRTYKQSSDIDKLNEPTFILARLYKISGEKMYIYGEEGYCFEKSDKTPEEILDIVRNNLIGSLKIKNHPVMKLDVEFLSVEQYKHKYAHYNPTCSNCNSVRIITGNGALQKHMAQVPNSKNKFYGCSKVCIRDYKEKMKRMNGTASDKIRKRYHENKYIGTYGYIYGIYNKKEEKWYIGKAARSPFARWDEHLMKTKVLHDMPFTDLAFHVFYEQKATGDADTDLGQLWDAECEFVEMYDSVKNGYNTQMPQKYIKQEVKEAEELKPEEVFKSIFNMSSEEYVLTNNLGTK